VDHLFHFSCGQACGLLDEHVLAGFGDLWHPFEMEGCWQRAVDDLHVVVVVVMNFADGVNSQGIMHEL
jgi:hypothetical protein